MVATLDTRDISRMEEGTEWGDFSWVFRTVFDGGGMCWYFQEAEHFGVGAMPGGRWMEQLLKTTWFARNGWQAVYCAHSPSFGLSLLPPPDSHPDKVFHTWAGPSSLAAQEPHGWRTPVDCVRANEFCAAESSCSSRYRTLRQCVAGRDRNTMLANKECQAALEVLQESPLYDCHCKRGMKKELLCLQIYWSIHLGLTGGKHTAQGGTAGWDRVGLQNWFIV